MATECQRELAGSLKLVAGRPMPAASDILVFNIGGTTATNVQLRLSASSIVSGNKTVDLQSSTAIALWRSGEATEMILLSSETQHSILMARSVIAANLRLAATATINGTITFSSSGLAAHRLTADDVAAITRAGPPAPRQEPVLPETRSV